MNKECSKEGPLMNEEYSNRRNIPDDNEGQTGSRLSVSTFSGTVRVIISSPHNAIASCITLTVNNAAWLAEQLEHAADTIVHNALESEETEQ